MISVLSWQNSVSLCPASFCTPRPTCLLLQVTGVTYYYSCSYQQLVVTSYFCIPIPYDEKYISFWCQFQEVSQVFIKLFNFSCFSISVWGIDLDYCDIEWFALETNRDHSIVFEVASKYCISDSFIDCGAYSISSKGFLPTVVDIMVI